MSEKKRKVNPWVPVVVMGVVAILFSVYAFQSQMDVMEAKKEMEQLKGQMVACQKEAETQQRLASNARRSAQAEVEKVNQELEDCKKNNKRK